MKNLKIDEMLLEYLENPIGIDIPDLRFSWTLNGDGTEAQFSYHITVEKDGYDLWDSGSLKSSDMSYALNGAVNFESNCDYTLSLTVYDEFGGYDNKTSYFSTGLINASDWSAKWIGKRRGEVRKWDENGGNTLELLEKVKDITQVQSRSVLIRKECQIDKKIKRAVAYVCGLGLNEFYINGEKVGDKILTPLVTDYSKRVLYDTYDVTRLLECGLNMIGIELGSGWYCPQKKYWDWRMQ